MTWNFFFPWRKSRREGNRVDEHHSLYARGKHTTGWLEWRGKREYLPPGCLLPHHQDTTTGFYASYFLSWCIWWSDGEGSRQKSVLSLRLKKLQPEAGSDRYERWRGGGEKITQMVIWSSTALRTVDCWLQAFGGTHVTLFFVLICPVYCMYCVPQDQRPIDHVRLSSNRFAASTGRSTGEEENRTLPPSSSLPHAIMSPVCPSLVSTLIPLG